MAIIKCKMCGGDVELTADKTFGTCEFCGNTMAFPKVDDDQRAAAFNRGNHFRRIGEFDKALAVYERIVREDDTDAEAHWCCALCRFGIEYVEDPATYEWLPTCHRASFDSFLEDVDYLAAIGYSEGITRRQYQKDAVKIAEVQRGILATSQNEEPFDVFICYKESDEHGQRTWDSLMAQDVYYQLSDQGYRVFFSRITLEDVVGKQYEPYIFAALNSAKVMIVIGTKPEYMNAIWVKNEWSRFLAMMKKDRNKLLLPCYRDMDPYDMPEQLSVLQSYDMSKIGFIQDLIRGIRKVLNANKKPEVVHESVTQTGSNMVALLKRGNMALEDGEWDKADQFFEEVLNQDAECVEAYIGKTLAQLRLPNIDSLVQSGKAFGRIPHFQKAIRFSKDPMQQTLKDIRAQNQAFLLERGARLLAQKQWQNANGVFDEALINEPDCVEAFLGKALAQLQFVSIEMLPTAPKAFSNNAHYQNALRIAKNEQLQKLKDYTTQHQTFALEQGNRYLQDGQWTDAAALFEMALVNDPLCMDAHIGLGLAQCQCQSLPQLAEKHISESEMAKERQIAFGSEAVILPELQDKQTGLNSHIDEMVRQHSLPSFTDSQIRNAYKALTQITLASTVVERKQQLGNEKAFWRQNPHFSLFLNATEGETNPVLEARKQVLEVMQRRRDEAMKQDRAALEKILADFDAQVQAIDQNVITKSEEVRREQKQRKMVLEEGRRKAALVKSRISVSPNIDYPLHIGITDNGHILSSGIDRYRSGIEDWSDILCVSTGEYHAVASTVLGTAVAKGDNRYGQCNVSSWNNIVEVAAGGWFSVGLQTDGCVCAVGHNEHGQCNVSHWRDIVKIAAGRNHTVGLKANGRVVATGLSDDNRCNVSLWTDIVDIWAFNGYTVGLRANGTVLTTMKQFHTSGWTDIVSVSTGYEYILGLRKDGTVVFAGKNNSGSGNVDSWENIVDISILNCHSVGLCADGTVVATGLNDSQQCAVSAWRDICAVSVSTFCTLGIRCDGTVVRAGDCKRQPYIKTNRWKLFQNIDALQNKVDQMELKQKTAADRRAQNLCQHCGGTFKRALFSTKCAQCGTAKDY